MERVSCILRFVLYMAEHERYDKMGYGTGNEG